MTSSMSGCLTLTGVCVFVWKLWSVGLQLAKHRGWNFDKNRSCHGLNRKSTWSHGIGVPWVSHLGLLNDWRQLQAAYQLQSVVFLKFDGSESDRDYFAEHDPPDKTNYFIRSKYLKNLSNAKVLRKSVTTVDGQNPAPSKTVNIKNGIINQPQPVSSICEAFYGYQHLNIHQVTAIMPVALPLTPPPTLLRLSFVSLRC